jgi:DNA-binding NarL/FixJ family response regulator
MISVAIIEDNRLVREGIKDILKELPDVEVVLATATFESSILREAEPHVVLLDIGLHDNDCLQVAETIRREARNCEIVVMDLLPAHEDIAQFVNLGVAGFILKDATLEDFVATIRSVASGERVLPTPMTSTLFSQIAQKAIQQGAAIDDNAVHMTQREREVIALIADGMSNKEMAQRLSVATETVKSHVRNVMEKLALHTRLQIAAYANQQTEERLPQKS